MFTGDPTGKLPREEEINGVRVRRFKSFSPSDAYHVSLAMTRELSKAKFDIVHGHNYHALPLYFAKNAEAGKFIVTPHYHGGGHTPVRNFLIKLYHHWGQRIFDRQDKVIADSRYEKQLLLRDFTLDASEIAVIPCGVDLSEFRHLSSVPRDSKRLLYVGRLEEYKGVQYILQALALLEESFHLDIVGKGPYKAKLLRLADQSGIAGRVNFYQDLSRQELLRMYAGAGVFLLLSLHEAFAIVVAEALAAGTPCIVANTSALTEWIDNRNCFGIDYPIKANELAGLITEVIGTEVGDVKLWDWSEVTERIKALYEKLQ